MRAIILAGGEGTRLRPLTYTTPKPMIDVHGRTLTEHVFSILKTVGVTDVTLSISYLADKIQAYFGDGSAFGMHIEFLIEPSRMGTAGALVMLKREGKQLSEDFLLMNGDNLFALDLPAMIRQHAETKAVATIALTEVEDVSTRGVVALDGNRITEFVEKPDPANAPSHFVSSGYYMCSPKIFDYIDTQKEFSMLERDVFPVLASEGNLFGFTDAGQWFDTGTPERYEQVKAEWRGPKA